MVIHRYQNSPRRLSSAIAVAVLLCLLVLKSKLTGATTVWICHNVDQETSPHHKNIERIRRKILIWFSDHVFVLDRSFLPFLARKNVGVISFGEKVEGSISRTSVESIKQMSAEFDRLILIAGQDGGKYKGFERIPALFEWFNERNLSVAFITAGMSDERRFGRTIEKAILRIDEPNIDERALKGVVDYVYRENNDISVPYSIYSAATAGIPILTTDRNIVANIVRRERIGVALEDLSIGEVHTFDFDQFLRTHRWDSLAKTLRIAGVDV